MQNNDFSEEIMSGNISKLLRHKEFMGQNKTPITAQFILTNKCNLRCVFCVNKKRWGNQEMSKNDAFEVLNDLKDLGTKGIEFTGGCEPTIHPNFSEILEYAISLNLTPALVTNGVKLSSIPSDLLNKLDWIRVSINASRDLYKKIHGAELYDEVMEGLEHISNLSIPNKGVSYIYCKLSSMEDTQLLIDDLQKFHLDYFRFSIDVFSDLKFTISPLNLCSKSFPVISHSNRPTAIPKFCNIFYYKPVIDCSGLVYPCCTNMHREVLPLGKVKDIKKIISNKNIKLDLSKCLYCIYGSANDFIVNMDRKIKNENFV